MVDAPNTSYASTVPTPDLEIRAGEGGGGVGGRGRSPKKIYSALQASVWSRNKRGGGPSRPLP